MFPFDAEVLASSYALYNTAIWPAQPFALALALTAVWLTVSPHPFGGRIDGGRIIGAILAAGWLWCAFVFFLGHMAPLDFMASVYGWAFVGEAALLLWFVAAQPLRVAAQPAAATVAGLVMAMLAVCGLPLVSGLGEAGFASARIVGVAPGPTVLFTLAMLLLVEGRVPWVLLPIPLLWCGVAAVTGWALGIPEGLIQAMLGLLAVSLALWKSHHSA